MYQYVACCTQYTVIVEPRMSPCVRVIDPAGIKVRQFSCDDQQGQRQGWRRVMCVRAYIVELRENDDFVHVERACNNRMCDRYTAPAVLYVCPFAPLHAPHRATHPARKTQ